MSRFKRCRQKQLLREAEGYLELITVFAGTWSPSPSSRTRLAQRALDALVNMGNSPYQRTRVLYLKGQSLSKLDRFGDAIVPLESAADLDGDNIHVWLALGWCHKRTGRLDLAIQSLEEALGVDPDQAIVHFNLACYWSLANNPKLAVAYLSSAFDLDDCYRDLVANEPDFDTVRHHPDFMALTTVIV